MNLWTKIIAGGLGRKSRLHDLHGNLVPLSPLFRNGPRAFLSGIYRLVFGRLPRRPWISYDGQAMLRQHLGSGSRVLEFGSGTSTPWYAEHAGFVVSVEENEEWFGLVGKRLGNRDNIVRLLETDPHGYAAAGSLYAEQPFDLIMIDGMQRDKCLYESWPLLRHGGLVYLDNSDQPGCPYTGDIPAARAELVRLAQAGEGRLVTLVDFAPSQLFVNQAIVLIKNAQ